MISSLQLSAQLKVALTRAVASGAWPAVTQGDDAIAANLANVDVAVWNDAYIAKLTIAGGASTTVDLRSFTDLVFEAGKSLSKLFGIAIQVALADAALTNGSLVLTPGAVNGLVRFFSSATDGISMVAGETLIKMRPATDVTGFATDATHKTLTFTNPGTHSIVVTVVIPGAN